MKERGVRGLNTRVALYRAWRPQTFQDVVGQQHITQTLHNSLKENKVSHAYLFSGPRGTGKTSTAKILAKAVNCERGLEHAPCNECSACQRIQSGAVMDVVEIDAASNRGVEEIREIRDKVKYAPAEVRRKVYIIDEVHMLTPEAFNALLKTLEEPPEHAMFILATTEPHKLPATIISRCQRFDFRRVPLTEQIERMRMICAEEGIDAEERALHYLARLSDGGMRDALSLLDQVSAFSGSQVTYETAVAITGGIPQEQFQELAEAVLEQSIGRALEIVDQFIQDGKSADKCLENMLLYFRDLLMALMAPDTVALQERLHDLEAHRQLAERFGRERLFAIIETINRYQVELKYAVQPRTILEVAVLKLCTDTGTAAENISDAPWKQELDQLRAAVQKLQQEVTALRQQGIAANRTAAMEPADQPGMMSRTRREAASARKQPARSIKSAAALQVFIEQADEAAMAKVLDQWPLILQQVKDRKITVHAWLIDGEPVAVAKDSLLLAFKSAMHRETTEKPANRQLIEQVIQEVLGQPLSIATVMRNDWQAAQERADDHRATSQPEVLQLTHEEEPEEKDWIKEAIQLFGEDLVKIKDE